MYPYGTEPLHRNPSDILDLKIAQIFRLVSLAYQSLITCRNGVNSFSVGLALSTLL